MAMSRVFISHSSADNAAALALASWLEANGWSDYFLDIDDTRGIAPGERWMAALAGAVNRCEAVLFLVSPAWKNSKYCFAEFFQAKNLGKRIFGVIVEPIPLTQLPEQMTAEWQVCDLTDARDSMSFTVVRLPFVPETVVSFPRAGLEDLARGIRKAGLAASTFLWPPERQPDRPPFPGLRALEEVDAAVFFGREAAIVRAIDQIRLVRERDVEQLFVILGASGAGKSSFLRAGLLPRLKRDSENFVVLRPVRPERAAISGAQGLLACLKAALAAAGQDTSCADLRAELASSSLAGVLGHIVLAASRGNPSDRRSEPTLIVPIDQAEELFAADGGPEANQLLTYFDALREHLVAAVSPGARGRLRALFLITIRSDSLARLQGEPGMQALSPVLFSLPAMPASEFKAVIEGPARRHSEAVKRLVISPQLTEQLVVDADGADALPLLALTLEWLYREFTTIEGTRIGQEEYQRLGGVRGVIDTAVRRAFEQPGREPSIPPQVDAQERLLLQIFPYIATVDPDTGDWKRRVASREALRTKIPQAEALVARLIEQRLLLSDVRPIPSSGEPIEVIEVAHEALLRQWETLQRWLKDLSAALSVAESLRRSANDWHRSNGDEALLVHTAHRLQAAEALLSDERLEGRVESIDREYLAACRRREHKQAQEREDKLQQIALQQAARAKLQRRASWGLSAAALAVLGLGVWIVVQTREVSLQASSVLAAAADAADDAKLFDQGMRLGVLATRSSWLHPAHPTAAPSLSRAADGSVLRTLLRGHSAYVYSASFSPDGRRVVTASQDRTARIWDADSGAPMGEAMRHTGQVYSASFSPDGKRVVTASTDNTAQIWDSETGKPLGAAMKHDDVVYSARFSPDGKRVVTASKDKTARIWDAETGKAVGEVMTHGELVFFVCFSPDGKHLVTASADNTARIWDAETGKPVGKAMTHLSIVFSARFSPDGTRVVTASDDKTARIWDSETGLPTGEVMTHDDSVISARFSPDGRHVVTASSDRTARLWDAETGKPVGEAMTHGGQVNSASFSPDGKLLVTTSRDGTARIWYAETGKPAGEEMVHGGRVMTARFSPDGKRVVTASWDTTARIWDADTGKRVGEAMTHGSGVYSAQLSPNGKRVVTASKDGTARVWNAETGKSGGEAISLGATVYSASFSPDGKRVVTASEDNTARIWDAETGKNVGQVMTHDSGVHSASFSPDGKRVVTASWDMTARVWDVETGKPVGEAMRHHLYVYSARFSPDGKRVVTGSYDKTARVWDVETGKPVGETMKHNDYVYSASFNSNGRRVVTASADRTARVWDAETGKPVGEVMRHDDRVVSAAFSPDDKRVVTSSADKTARIWDAETGKPLGEPMTHGAEVKFASFSPDGKLLITASKDGTARIWDAETGKPAGEPMAHDGEVNFASFGPDASRVVTASEDRAARVWDAFWPAISHSEGLTRAICQRKLRGEARHITEADVRAGRILSAQRIGEDVCDGIF